MSWIAVAVIGGAVIGAGASIYSGSKAAGAAESAAASQSAAARESNQAQLEMYYKSREDTAPWREAGVEALGTARKMVAEGPPPFETSPYYNFLVGETNKSLVRSQSARGILDSGAALREASRYGENLASGEYQNYLTNWINTKLNPNLSLSGAGQVSAGQAANAALTTGQNIGQNYLYAGNAAAQGAINTANARIGAATGIASAVNQGANNYLFYNYLQNMANPTIASQYAQWGY